MFERWKKDPKTEKLNQQDIENMKNNRAKALLAASVGALGVTMANQVDVTDLHQPGASKQEQKVTAGDLQKMQEQGSHGATVSINPEAGQAVVTMRPPGDEKPVSIDLRHPIYDVNFNKDDSIKSVKQEAPHGTNGVQENVPPVPGGNPDVNIPPSYGNPDVENPPPVPGGNPG